MDLLVKVNTEQKVIKKCIWGNEYHLKPGINLLFGGNGAGKTSLISLLRYKANPEWRNPEYGRWTRYDEYKVDSKEDIKLVLDNGETFKGQLYYYSNSNNNPMRKSDQNDDFDMYDLVRKRQGFSWSEGMNVSVVAYDFIYAIQHHFQDKGLILVDEIDSGLDAVSCSLVMNKLIEAVKGKEDKFYILVTFNQFEIARAAYENDIFDWINCYTGERESIPASYNQYFNKLYAEKTSHRRLGDEGAWGADEDDWYDDEEGMTHRERRELEEKEKAEEEARLKAAEQEADEEIEATEVIEAMNIKYSTMAEDFNTSLGSWEMNNE